MNGLKLLCAISILAISTAAHAVVLVQTSDPGYYNNNLGTILNGTNGGESGPFPVTNDSTLTFASAPDLSAASGILGNWLSDPLNLNLNWSYLPSIPNSWAVGTEVAAMYQFNTLGATNVVASFGVDNGIFVWLDGTYLFGARAAGGHTLGEYIVNVGDLTSGTHFLQLLLEDHGSTNGYDVQITADSFIPGPPPGGGRLPEPATYALFGIGIVAIAYQRRKQSKIV